MSYAFNRSVTIDHTKCGLSNSTNFSMLILGSYNYLATVANGGNVQNTVGFNGQTVPADLAFYSDAGGTTLLKWDVASYNPATGAIEVWIKIPTVSNTVDTVIYMFYGDAAVVTYQGGAAGNAYDANYKGVYHLQDNAATTVVLDALASTNLTNTANTAAKSAAGKIGNCLTYNGINDKSFDTVTTHLWQQVFTLSAWVNPTGAGGRAIFGFLSNGQIELRIDGATQKLDILKQGVVDLGQSVATVINAAWQYVVTTYDVSGNWKHYINGAPSGAGTNLQTFNFTDNPAWGAAVGVSEFYNGLIDEARMASVVRSADWILTEFNNQNTPSTFYTIGSAGMSSIGGRRTFGFPGTRIGNRRMR